MPTPLSHIAYASKLRTGFADEAAPAFWIGSVFPDIRHIGIVKKTDTHHPVARESLAGVTDPFTLGTEFHNWLDIRREELAGSVGLYASDPPWPLKTATKFLEDELTHAAFAHWLDIAELFRSVRAIPSYPDLPAGSVQHWYSALAAHCDAGPSTLSAGALLHATTESPDDIAAVLRHMDTLRTDPELHAKLGALVAALFADCETVRP